MAFYVTVPFFAVLFAASTSHPSATLSSLLSENGLNANFNPSFNDIQQQQQTQPIPVQNVPSTLPGNPCLCSQPQTEIFVTETPQGSEIIAAETSSGRGVSLATVNDYVQPSTAITQQPQVLQFEQPQVISTVQQQEEQEQQQQQQQQQLLTTVPHVVPQSPMNQPMVVHPNHSYAGSLSGALSGSGHFGHILSAAGSLAGNLGYTGSLPRAGSGYGHSGSMSGSMVGPDGVMAGSLAGSHSLHGSSMTGSLAGSHPAGNIAGSLSGSDYNEAGGLAGSFAGNHHAGSLAGSIAGINQGGTGNAPVENTESIQSPVAGSVGQTGGATGNHGGIDRNGFAPGKGTRSGQGVSGNLASSADGPGGNGVIPGDVSERQNFQNHGALAGSVAGASRLNSGPAFAGSLASTSGNRHSLVGSMAGAQGNGQNGLNVISGSLAGSQNGLSHAVSGAMVDGYPQQQLDKQPFQNYNVNSNSNHNGST